MGYNSMTGVSRKLRAIMFQAAQKIHANRHKDTKWPGQAFDESKPPHRSWQNTSYVFMYEKLREESEELIEAVSHNHPVPDILKEAGDVTACAMFLADKHSALLNLSEVPLVVCLCGSTKFGDAYREANLKETLAGNIVLSVGAVWQSEGMMFTPEQKIGLDILHKRKIDLADEILVLNVGGYIGESTRSEIEYAIKTGKPVRYLEDPNLTSGPHPTTPIL